MCQVPLLLLPLSFVLLGSNLKQDVQRWRHIVLVVSLVLPDSLRNFRILCSKQDAQKEGITEARQRLLPITFPCIRENARF